MPLAIDPNALFRIVLNSDKDKEKPPTFVYRYLTGRQWRSIAEIQDKMDESGSIPILVDSVYKAVATGLVDWENMIDRQGEKIKFDTKKLEDMVGVIEAQELIVKLLKQTPDDNDKKKLDLQLDSNSKESAATVKV